MSYEDDDDEFIGGDGRTVSKADNRAKNPTGKQLLSYIERIEQLEEDKKGISDDIKDVYTELKGNGFDKKAVREIVKLRKKSRDEVQEERSILDTYLHAIGYEVD